MKIKAIITGASGMVGEGVLHECLLHPDVEEVLVIGRRTAGITHRKLKEILHSNFYDLSAVKEQLKGYNACYFCLGVSSVGMKEKEYHHVTYDLTMHMATLLAEQNPEMTFCYVSGAGTDSTEHGKMMWARVKGQTENDLMRLPFKAAYMFRPGFMKPTKGLKHTLKGYAFFSWLYPVLKPLFPNFVSTLKELGLAMINVTIRDYDKPILEVKDIVKLANES
ncbi:NAD-dependent epimerase/dehydratase family protein [Niastella caeni]|uniref:NAD-dependent epimerase/dehydratase family protein n=1 Tax=Niastella caeni TaxID=2569763 RepID=A0A4S8HP27_9BACT|nr:NAD-dependent epimerase/dehydratase family protein [Niastella caeni]THU37107.1 NAD-dependent epimerase/dehydratase family protein [Niastella caeni]